MASLQVTSLVKLNFD